mgnify:CR=1 FL=1
MIKDVIWNILCDKQWFRERVGGVWEKWYVGDGPNLHKEWFYRGCKKTGERPNIYCKGTPEKEDYREHKNISVSIKFDGGSYEFLGEGKMENDK